MKQLLKENSKWKNVGWFFRILFMIFALTPGCLTTLSDGLDGLHVEMVFLTMGVGAVCWITKDESLRKNRWLHVLCAFFAFTTVMGTSYHEQGSWNYVFGNFAQFLLALVVMAGYYNLYESLIALGAYVSEHWEGVRRREIKGKIENFIFEAHPFWSTFAIAMLCALPYMISFSRDRFRRMHLNRCGSTWELLKTAINTRWYPQQSWEDAWLSEEWYWDPTILEFLPIL